MTLLLKNLLFTVLVPGTVGFWLPLWIARDQGRTLALPWTPLQYAAMLPLALGVAIYLWCMWDFATHGRGTPAPIDPPRVLVSRGLYRYVRNPMYVGAGCMVAGWLIFFQTRTHLVYLVIYLFFVNLFVRFYEEPTLRRLFGDAYEDYCRRVKRWGVV